MMHTAQRFHAPQPYVPCLLIVDDDPETRKLFRRILEEVGYFVAVAENGRQAHAALRDHFFELMILDLAMPDIDGFELLKLAHAELPSLKILVVSGYMKGPMLKAAELFGAVAALDKATAPQSLLLAVCDSLRPEVPFPSHGVHTWLRHHPS